MTDESSKTTPRHRAEPESHVTKSNPSGAVRQCERRDLHEPHEYQPEIGAWFDVYCPGNDGSKR